MFKPSLPDNSDEAIERLLHTSRTYARSQGLADHSIDYEYITGYRRTLVFRVRIKSSKTALEFFAKVGADLSEDVRTFVEKEATMTTKVNECFQPTADIDIVKPLFYFADQAVFATASVPGIRLDYVLLSTLRLPTQKKIRHAEKSLELVSNWLKTFQTSWPQQGSSDRELLLEGIRHQTSRLSKSRPDLLDETLLEKIQVRTSHLAGDMNETAFETVTRHDDFAPWNIISNDSGIVVYDFPNVQRGAKGYDRYYFDHALSTFRYKPFVNKRKLEHLRSHFSATFGCSAGDAETEKHFYSIYFSLVRLSSLVFLGRPRFPKNILNRVFLKKEMTNLVKLCA